MSFTSYFTVSKSFYYFLHKKLLTIQNITSKILQTNMPVHIIFKNQLLFYNLGVGIASQRIKTKLGLR